MEMSSHGNRSINLNFPQTPTHWEALYALKKCNFTRCSWWKWCNSITHSSLTSCSYITSSDLGESRWWMVYERDEVAGIISLRVNSFAFNFIYFFWFHGTDNILSVLHSVCTVFLMCAVVANHLWVDLLQITMIGHYPIFTINVGMEYFFEPRFFKKCILRCTKAAYIKKNLNMFI